MNRGRLRHELLLHPQHVESMIAHGRFCWPNEACGLIAADGDRVSMVYCLTNIDASPSRFTVDPAEHYRAWRHARSCGWRIAGSFHSHPRSAAVPSPADIAGALDPDWAYLVVGPVRGGRTEARAYRIRDGVVAEMGTILGSGSEA